MKWKYGGWISSIPTISSPGTYTLSPLTSLDEQLLQDPLALFGGRVFRVGIQEEGRNVRGIPSR